MGLRDRGRGQRDMMADFGDGRGHEPQNAGSLQWLQKARMGPLSQSLRRGLQPVNPLIFGPLSSILDIRLPELSDNNCAVLGYKVCGHL